MTDTRRPPGRPSKYDEAYCDMVVEWGKLGKSKVWMACEIGVLVDTFDNWTAAHEEFFLALKLAVQFSLRWWEEKGQTSLDAEKFQTGLWTQNMSNRFGLCRTKIDTEHSGRVEIGEIKRTIVDAPPQPDA